METQNLPKNYEYLDSQIRCTLIVPETVKVHWRSIPRFKQKLFDRQTCPDFGVLQRYNVQDLCVDSQALIFSNTVIIQI